VTISQLHDVGARHGGDRHGGDKSFGFQQKPAHAKQNNFKWCLQQRQDSITSTKDTLHWKFYLYIL